MTANVDAMVRAGIEAYQAGNKSEAHALLEKAIELDDYNEQAWLWLSAVVESKEEQRTCLENVLVIDPDNARAKQGLKMLGVDPDNIETAPDKSNDSSPFSGSDFEASSAFGDADFSSSGDNSSWEIPPTATSSSSSAFQGDEPSSKDYDNWVAGLNLGTDDEATPPTTTPASPPAMDPIAASEAARSLFGDEDFDSFDSINNIVVEPEPEESFTSGPFDSQFDTSIEIDPSPTTTPAAAPVDEPIVSPGREDMSEIADDDLLSDISGAELTSSSGALLGQSHFADVDDYDNDLEEISPEDYFALIPDAIKVTRLPGTRESYPIMIMVGVIGLGILNAIALIMLISKIV